MKIWCYVFFLCKSLEWLERKFWWLDFPGFLGFTAAFKESLPFRLNCTKGLFVKSYKRLTEGNVIVLSQSRRRNKSCKCIWKSFNETTYKNIGTDTRSAGLRDVVVTGTMLSGTGQFPSAASYVRKFLFFFFKRHFCERPQKCHHWFYLQRDAVHTVRSDHQSRHLKG